MISHKKTIIAENVLQAVSNLNSLLDTELELELEMYSDSEENGYLLTILDPGDVSPNRLSHRKAVAFAGKSLPDSTSYILVYCGIRASFGNGNAPTGKLYFDASMFESHKIDEVASFIIDYLQP